MAMRLSNIHKKTNPFIAGSLAGCPDCEWYEVRLHTGQYIPPMLSMNVTGEKFLQSITF